MFYSYELLSSRCKGKLARCWLAATLSEQTFKRKYKLASIETIDVSVTCEEILNVLNIRNNTQCRFSLYLSSQLMFGVTKIFLYQTKLLQDHLLEINCALFKAISLEEVFVTNGNEIVIPSEGTSVDELRHAEKSTDLHLITEQSYTCIVEHLMQDQLNFGALTSFEVQQFLLMGSTELLNDVRTVPWDYSEQVPAEPPQLPLVDISRLEGETIRVEETGAASVRKNQEESLIVVADQQPRKTPPATPRKRTLKSAAETPTKRSRVSLKDASESLPPLPPPSVAAELAAPEVSEQVLAEVPAPEISELALPPAEVPEPEIPAAPVDALDLGVLQLPPIEDEEIVETRRNKRRTVLRVDEETKLSNAVIQKWISNVAIHTINQNTFTRASPSITQYLTRPSVKNCGKLWGKTLLKHYQQFLVKPVGVPNEFWNDLENENEDTIQGGTIRVDKSNKLPNETTELSKHPIILENTAEQPLKIIVTEETLIDVPEFPVIVENPTETIEIPNTYEPDERTRKNVSKSSSSCSKTSFTKVELLALLEVHWHEGEFVKFHELIPTENYSRYDAYCVFQYCLELHTEKGIILRQAEPFDTLWIQKHFNDASRIDSPENVTV